MGEDVEPLALLRFSQLAEYRKPVLPDGAIDLHILVGNEGCQFIGCFHSSTCGERLQMRAHPVQRPAQVDCRRSGRNQHTVSLFKPSIAAV